MTLYCIQCLKSEDPEDARQASYMINGSSICTEHALQILRAPMPGLLG